MRETKREGLAVQRKRIYCHLPLDTRTSQALFENKKKMRKEEIRTHRRKTTTLYSVPKCPFTYFGLDPERRGKTQRAWVLTF